MGFVGAIIGVMVGVIILVAVAIPVITTTITNLSTTGRNWNGSEYLTAPVLGGTTLLVVGLVPVMIALAGIILVVKLYSD